MIDAARIAGVAAQVERCGVGETVVAQLRRELPELHFTYCMDDDVPAMDAVHETPEFCIYLVDGRGHCVAFTDDMKAATGLVIAEREPE